MLSQTFKDAQAKWMEEMLSNKNDLCDTIFIVGSEKKKLWGLRALLANISPVFKAQLYGNFKESSLNEVIEYPTIPSNIFECILRVSFGLNPLITEHTAVPLIEASHMLQIEPLQRECQYYLQHCINKTNVLFLLNSAYCLNSLDSHLYGKCRKIILTEKSKSILFNDGFYSLHPELVIDIISSNDFKAKEENIWNACFKWAENVISKSLKFPRKNKSILQRLRSTMHGNLEQKDASDEKKVDFDASDDDEFSLSEHNYYYKQKNNQEFSVEYILEPIIPYIRYPLMDKTFFVENVCKYLKRDQSESVLIHFVLNTKSIFSHEERKSFVTFNVIAANKEFESAEKLGDLSQDALFCSQLIENKTDRQWFIIDILFVGIISKIEIKNRYSDKDTLKTFKLQISTDESVYDEEDIDDFWIDVQRYQSAKSNSWQSFEVDLYNLNERKSRYWKIVLIDTYGGYTKKTLSEITLLYMGVTCTKPTTCCCDDDIDKKSITRGGTYMPTRGGTNIPADSRSQISVTSTTTSNQLPISTQPSFETNSTQVSHDISVQSMDNKTKELLLNWDPTPANAAVSNVVFYPNEPPIGSNETSPLSGLTFKIPKMDTAHSGMEEPMHVRNDSQTSGTPRVRRVSTDEKNIAPMEENQRLTQIQSVDDISKLGDTIRQSYQVSDNSSDGHSDHSDESGHSSMDAAEMAEIERLKSKRVTFGNMPARPGTRTSKIFRAGTISPWDADELDDLQTEMKQQMMDLSKQVSDVELHQLMTSNQISSGIFNIGPSQVGNDFEDLETPSSNLFRDESDYKWNKPLIDKEKEEMTKQMMYLARQGMGMSIRENVELEKRDSVDSNTGIPIKSIDSMASENGNMQITRTENINDD